MNNQSEELNLEKLQDSFKSMKESYSTVIKCQDVILTAENEREIYEKVCKILVEEGPYKLAWIGSVGNDSEKRVTPVAEAGFKKGYLSSINISWGDNFYGQGPAGRTIRECKEYIVKDIMTDINFLPWRKKAEEYGYKSVMTIPIVECNGSVIGVLSLYSDREDAFKREEVELFYRLAGNIAQGICILRLKKEKEESEQTHYEILLKTIDAFVLAIEKRDPYTAGHQKRVSELAVAIGKKAGLNENRIEGLRLGALIHDIGKIYVPGEILNRPGKITKPEFDLIKLHPEIGQEIIGGIDFPWDIEKMIIQHHERLDGSGYPNGLKDEEIIIESKIITVSDVVEAISSHRPYRAALGIRAALDEIKQGRGTKYDSEIVVFCVKLFESEEFQWEAL